MANRRPRLDDAKLAALERAFRDELSISAAARAAGVSEACASRHYKRIAEERARLFDPPPPRYDGPDWIGKACRPSTSSSPA